MKRNRIITYSYNWSFNSVSTKKKKKQKKKKKNGEACIKKKKKTKKNNGEASIIRPPLGLEKGGLYQQVVFIFISIYDKNNCSEIDGLRIQLVFLDSGHIIQVSLYIYI